jgi:hypothetical protein
VLGEDLEEGPIAAVGHLLHDRVEVAHGLMEVHDQGQLSLRHCA